MASKLVEWLYVLIPLTSAWLLLINNFPVTLTDKAYHHVLLAPVYAIIGFGLSCVLLLIYRVITFNECPEAYKELRSQIEEARADLTAKGMKFD